MPPAPLCPNEAARLEALRSLDILDTPPSDVFDSFVRIACGLFDVPFAAITLIDENRVWFKAARGAPLPEGPRDMAFCAHAILQADQVLCVPDALGDERFADNPHVTAPGGLRFYAGAPLVDDAGHALGALCVADTQPRNPDPATLSQLRDLATGVMAALRLHAALQKLSDQARRDPLTGLHNRREFDAALQVLGRRAATLFMLDLDDFKGVNDAFGHSGADAALREVAARLVHSGRRSDRMYRLGGDAFAFLAEGMRDPRAALSLAAAMHGALQAPFAIDGQVVPLRVSIGIAGIPLHAKTADELMRAADAALFAAKRSGRSTTRVAPLAGRSSRLAGDVGMGRMTMRDQLREALLTPRFEQFVLHFQPVVDLVQGRVATQEALVRWALPDGRQVGPADFVPVAEDSGLISHLDRWVLHQACTIAARWTARWRLSVNISPVTIGLLDLVGLVRETLARTGLAPENLVIEVTETAAVADPSRMVETINGLRALGVQPIVDDFGAGHASLAFLRRYPFLIVKTDRSFVTGLGTDPRATPVMEALVRLAASLDMPLVAEGVETEDQLMILHQLAVPKVQGFLLARPVPANRMEQTALRAERKLARVMKRHGWLPSGGDGDAEPARLAVGAPRRADDAARLEPLVA
jgi:diguanylate cyclase (GGDEF)-like protein